MILRNLYHTDVRRIKLYLNGSVEPIDTTDPEVLWHELLDLLDGSVSELYRIIPYLTQVCFADVYIKETNKLNENEHLLCEPGHTVHLVIQNACEWGVTAKRKFTLVYNGDWNLDTCTITITRSSDMSCNGINVQYDAVGLNQTHGSIILNQEISF